MSESTAIDRTWARAIFEAAGSDVATVADELAQVAALEREAPEQWEALVAPAVSASARRRVLDRLLADAKPITRNAVLAMVDHGRLTELPGIAAELTAMVDERAGRLDVQVTTAVELSSELRTRLEQRLSASTGRTVQLHATVDPEIIGGLVVRHGDTLVDTSLRGRLEQLRLALTRPGGGTTPDASGASAT